MENNKLTEQFAKMMADVESEGQQIDDWTYHQECEFLMLSMVMVGKNGKKYRVSADITEVAVE